MPKTKAPEGGVRCVHCGLFIPEGEDRVEDLYFNPRSDYYCWKCGL